MAEISSYGTKLYVSYTKNSTYTEVAEIEEGALPELRKDNYEAKTLDQATRAKQYRGTYFDGGEPQFKMVFDKTRYAALLAAAKDPDAYPVRIVLNDHATEGSRSKIEFSALVTNLGAPLSAGGERIVCDVTFKVSGDVTFTASA
jgi:hypothetical protein